jgi:opacity protein-like surface antigen
LGGQAQEWSPGGYLTAYGGANLMNDLTITTGGQTLKASPETGYRAGLAIGYELRPWFALEFDTGFQDNSLHELQSSSVKSLPLLINGIFRVVNSTRIVPYAGIGAGGAVCTLDDPAGADINVAFGYQLTAGVEYELTPQLRFGALYKFFGTTEQKYSIAGTEFKIKDAKSHFVGANLTWSF